jgi:hypothetical protein
MNVPYHTVMLGMVSILSDLERGTSKGKGKREAKNGRQRAEEARLRSWKQLI